MLTRRTQALSASVGLAVSFLIVGCEAPPKTKQPLLLFPAPPAKPRIQFLTWASGADQVEQKRSDFADFIVGEEPVVKQVIDKPYGVAAREGVVYVCDAKGLCLHRLDFKNHACSILGVRGPGRLRKPINVVIDEMGYKFVADPVRKQIVIFGPDDEFAAAFDIPQPCRPVDLAIWEDELFVLDNDSTTQIVVLDRQTGEVLRTFGSTGPEPGQFSIPSSLCFGPEGNLYVSDTLNWRIQKLTRTGEVVWTKGTAGYRLGQFGRPRGLRVGPDGVVYVADAATEIIQLISSEGDILMHFGGPGTMPGALVLPSTLAIDASSIPYFQEYIHEDFRAEYLLFVASQYGKHLVSVYAFGSFPDGYKLAESEIAILPRIAAQPKTVPAQQARDEAGSTGPSGEGGSPGQPEEGDGPTPGVDESAPAEPAKEGAPDRRVEEGESAEQD